MPAVLVCVAIGIKLYRMALVEPPMGLLFDGYRKSCTYSETNPFYNFICVIEPLFKDLVTNDIGKSFLTAFGTSGAVMSTYLFLKGGEGNRSLLFSPLITISHTLAGQALGAGIVGPMLLPALSAISKSLAPINAPSPSPPTYGYTVTLLAMQFTVFLLSMALSSVPPTNANWPYINYTFQAFPLLFIPLFFFPSRRAQPDAPIPTLSISAFTFFKYLYAPLWWVTLAQGLNAYYRQGQPFTPPCYFMALDFAGFVLTFLGMYAVDAVAGEAQAAMGVPRLVVGLLVAGPASTMAAYFGMKQRLVMERAETERTKRI
ncbi:hypothetical protein B0H13DRAFT_327514 [Mycena leptocephala]|nr:hypothetical protein B0H13DRAFT_327514 [Mycena leptocephala]